MKTLRTWFLIVAVAAVAFFAGTWAISSSAQESQIETPATEDAKPPSLDQTGPRGDFRGRGGPRGERGEHAIKGALIKATADATSLDHSDIIQQLRNGSSLTAVAEANGSSEQAVIDTALANIETRLTEAVANGRITEAEKTTALEAARTEAPTIMQTEGLEVGSPGGHGPHGHHNGRGMLVDATATVTGLTREEVIAEVESGKSLAQVAEAHGKTTDDIIAELRTRGEERLDQMLENAREAINTVPER